MKLPVICEGTNQPPTIPCYDVCRKCKRRMNRFWVCDEEHFKERSAQTLGHVCPFDEHPLESVMEGSR